MACCTSGVEEQRGQDPQRQHRSAIGDRHRDPFQTGLQPPAGTTKAALTSSRAGHAACSTRPAVNAMGTPTPGLSQPARNHTRPAATSSGRSG